MDDRQLRDAILVKIALEGKDYRTARREVLEARSREDRTVTSAEEPASPTQIDSFVGEVTLLDVEHLEMELTTSESHIAVEATRITYTHLSVSRRTESRKQDPLVIDLLGLDPQLTGLEGGRTFDLDGNGTAAPMSFVQDSSAFLALDRDGDGHITSGKELFGDQHGAMDGYEELRKFDTDTNGRIDAADPVYTSLRLLYGDLSQSSLEAAGIRSLELDARVSERNLGAGDSILRTSSAMMSDGRRLSTYAMALQTLDLSA